MTPPVLIGYDAQGSSGDDLSLMLALYLTESGRVVAIPATTPDDEIAAAMIAALEV